jgi:hypothetical protein
MPSVRRVDEGTPQVDGLRLIERVDDCGRGEVWRARHTGGLGGEDGAPLPGDLPGVGECRVRLLRMPVDEAFRARGQALAGDLTALDEPGLLTVREVRTAYDGIALVYGQLPKDVTGLHLIARRRLLRAGEVVTLGVALSWALAHAHAAGIVHGRLTDADVLIGGDGRPVLTGVGVLGVLGAPGEAADDVRALERMLGSLLDAGSAGAAQVSRALGQGSTTAAGLAALLAAAAPAVPIRLDESVPQAGFAEAPVRSRWRPAWLRPRMLLGAAGVVLLGGLAGWVSAPGPHARTSRPGAVAPTPVAGLDYRELLTRLDAAWARGFEHPELGFAAVDASASPALRADTAVAAALRARGLHAVGLRLVLRQVAVEAASPTRLILRVTDERSTYELRDARGKLVSTVAARRAAGHRIELVAAGSSPAEGWRFARVTDAPGGVSS